MKGAEDQYAWSTVNIVGNGPAVMVLANLDRGAGILLEDWTRPQGQVRTNPTPPDTTEMATTMARTAVAMRKWLSIVGAAK